MTVSTASLLGAVTPSRAEFRELAAAHRVIPVTRRLLADDETPVGVYRKLAGDRPGTFLLESAEHGGPGRAGRSSGRAQPPRSPSVDGERSGPATSPASCPPPATRSPRCAR